jgi:nucleoside-diphosphate-sugar epimerase
MARILITGASGFIGGHLVERALLEGHEVTAAVRQGSNRARLNHPKVTQLDFPLGDVTLLATILRKAGRFDWVIHNAGITKAISRADYRDGNAENTRRLVQAFQQSGLLPDKFLFVSSLAALGAAPEGRTRIFGDQEPHPLTPYGESKRLAESMLMSLPDEFPWVVVQPTAVYGPWERDILTFIQLVKKRLELRIGRRTQRLSFVHVEDLARAIYCILEAPGALHRNYIVSDGQGYVTEDLGAAVRAALDIKKTLTVSIPLGLVQQVCWVAEILSKLQDKPTALHRDKLPELAAENWHCDTTPLIDGLKFKPAFDLYSGMLHTVDWYKKQGWI